MSATNGLQPIDMRFGRLLIASTGAADAMQAAAHPFTRGVINSVNGALMSEFDQSRA